jgi:hypothetical protein
MFIKSGTRAIYHRIPITMLELFRSEMAKQGKFFRIRYRGPRFNTPSARYRGWNSKQSTCLREDAIAFSVYTY